MEIGEKIYSLRKQKGYSQEELADKLNVSRQTVSKWETGQSKPELDKLVPLCEVLEVTVNELLELEKEEREIHTKPQLSKIYFLIILAILLVILLPIYLEFHLSNNLIAFILSIDLVLWTCIIIYFIRKKYH